MRRIRLLLALAAGAAAGCAYSGTTSTTTTSTGAGASVVPARPDAPPPGMLLLDCQAPRLASTVHFRRIPSAVELNDLRHVEGLERVVLELPAWPGGYEQLQPLEQPLPGAELTVVLPGYPESGLQTEAWNLLQARPRIIVVARGEPPDRHTVANLNRMRGLERLVVWTEDPGAFRPERLVVPVSLRVMR